MSTWLGLCPLETFASVAFFGQMLSTVLSWEVIFCTLLCVDWWCTLRETAERPLQARSSKAAVHTCPNAWTFSSVTSCRSCRESWVNWSLVLRPLAAYLSVTWLLGISFFFFFSSLNSYWSVFSGKCNDTFLKCPVSKFQCALSVFMIILCNWHDAVRPKVLLRYSL